MQVLLNKNIVLGITGGIAAYKSVELARLLVKQGANVHVVMTRTAERFIGKLTFEAVTNNRVFTANTELDNIKNSDSDINNDFNTYITHINLARQADLVIIAPCTANFIAKLAHGLADDLLSNICLAVPNHKTIFIAPAMNKYMYENKILQNNLDTLKNIDNYNILNTAYGEQACGDDGYGRMLEPADILNNIILTTSYLKSCNKKILITAGPTIEAIDPVRYISNHSSGKMGYSLAIAASNLDYKVLLISGPVDSSLDNKILDYNKNNINNNIKVIKIKTAAQMHTAVLANINNQDIFISAAAVADYKCKYIAENKVKKDNIKKNNILNLELISNIDILQEVGKLKQKNKLSNNLFIVGFAAETEDLINNARKKIINKNLDLIILNNVADNTIGFNSEYNEVLLIARNNLNNDNFIKILKQPKLEVAKQILDFINLHIQDGENCVEATG